MDIEQFMLEIAGADRLLVHELTKLSMEPSKIEIAIRPQNKKAAEKHFECPDAHLKSLVVDPPWGEGASALRRRHIAARITAVKEIH